MKLEVLHHGEIVHTCVLGAAPVHLGRSSANDVVLRAPGISGHHALLYRTGGEVHLRDLGSTNGTFVNGVRVTTELVLAPGAEIGFGEALTARVVDLGESPRWRLSVEQLGSPLAWAVDRAVFALPGTGAAIRVGTREIWLLVDGEEVRRLEPGEPFLEGRFVVREEGATAETLRPTEVPLPYDLGVDLSSQRAALADEVRVVEVRAGNRVALLHALGEAWLASTGTERGWVDDDALGLGVWGRAHRANVPNNLNVLIHRIRGEVEGAGFDRWFIERRTGQTRVHVARVSLGPLDAR